MTTDRAALVAEIRKRSHVMWVQGSQRSWVLLDDVLSLLTAEPTADEKAIVTITLDEDGDFIARDLTRKGLVIHGENEASALQKMIELRRDYDALLTASPRVGRVRARRSPAPGAPDATRCDKCGASLTSDLTARNLPNYPCCAECGAVLSVRPRGDSENEALR